VAATILDFAGGEGAAQRYLPGCSARSLRPFLTGQAPEVRRVVYSENGGQFQQAWRMVDDGRHRYVRLLDSGEELLFDMAADPYCLHNLASAGGHRETVQRLRNEMLQIHIEHPAPKTGKAAFSPGTPHHITRQRLLQMPR
jgi:hypothetical protein